ncbi:CRISPR-associated endoribonuclease Cas6 [Alkaliphilus serpentinus]|uniref:CRISPR-associated endoribonuclease Cas6 n=1 Tax=Alkaliphilus serpentinus TaxID=1482731 RepID=A0A833M7Z9_9FIRM|nr:CRISPR-associated endoribonuclease Cas6 [Alkaliphilus serpentinus]KAB3529801.1 CRISPR-associated endoribonuclease Cas6 [Alkaliphilus serpentinus]
MKVYELTLKVYLLKDIYQGQTLERITEIIDSSLISTENFRNFHNSKSFKHYTFNSFYRLEEDQVYKAGKIYSVKIRTVDEMLVEHFKKNLANAYTEYIKGLTLDCRILVKKHIEKLYSITPSIIKTDQGYWKGHLSIEDYDRRLRENLIKKYNHYFNTKLDEDFELFYRIELNNHKPIGSSYKNVKLLGDKLTLYVAENKIAQKIAYFSLASGVGEMNSRGYGFINYKFL